MATNVIRFEDSGRARWGVVRGAHAAPLDDEYETTGDFLLRGASAARSVAVSASATLRPLAGLALLSPVTRNQQFICQFTNYKSHIIEGGRRPEEVTSNVIFRKASSCISPPNADIVKPSAVKLLDYEVELGVVIGKDISGPVDVRADDLSSVVGGLVIVNDVSARDIQIPQVQAYKAKSFRSFGPVGPFLTLLDPQEFALLRKLRLELKVNGELRQGAYADDMHFLPHQTITELSRVQDLFAGDLIATGTPGGTAIRAPSKLMMTIAKFLPPAVAWRAFLKRSLANPAYLKGGDQIEATIRTDDGAIDLGRQSNKIVSEAA
ncbi:MAG: fumarylacetoacetate hydrolase family protein [Parvularculaceae bacterium]|nr:fumarylacetoacetate hydrolase family protein [Parvularculaceae bacterium]